MCDDPDTTSGNKKKVPQSVARERGTEQNRTENRNNDTLLLPSYEETTLE